MASQAGCRTQQRASSLGNHVLVTALARSPTGIFPGPGVAWDLDFDVVVEQVLLENRKENERQREVSSSLNKCCSRRTRL